MPSTAHTLRTMAHTANTTGIWRGDQFATHSDFVDLGAHLDICALAYIAAENCAPPAEFYTDEDASLRLIECSAPAMQAIRAISAALDTQPCTVEIAPGMDVPDYIEHVSNWARTAPIGETTPPSTAEVIGRILRAAQQATQETRPGFTDAHGLCLTCGGHGSLTVDGAEIPYEELSPRRKQGYDLGHRFYRDQSKPCPHCDGQDRVTDAAVSAYEASL